MPEGTAVDKMYKAILHNTLSSGKSKQEAERIAAATAQKRTHQSLQTGKRLK